MKEVEATKNGFVKLGAGTAQTWAIFESTVRDVLIGKGGVGVAPERILIHKMVRPYKVDDLKSDQYIENVNVANSNAKSILKEHISKSTQAAVAG